MKAIGLKINTYIKDASVINNNMESVVLRFILLSFGALAILYVILLGNMVANIVQRRALEATARTLSSDVSDLELTYLSMSNNIDLSYSYSLGFKDTKPTFTTRKSVGLKTLDSVKIAQNGI